MIDQSNRAGKTSPILSTDPYTHTYKTEDAYNFMSPVPGMHHGYVYPAYHEGYTPGPYRLT